MTLRVAFVGVKRKFSEIPEDYHEMFVKHHLELPWYYARSGMCVDITNTDFRLEDLWAYSDRWDDTGGDIALVGENEFKDLKLYDVVVHWRKWFPEFYRPEAINVINCQDHSFSPQWIADVRRAYHDGQLHGILCFPTWHKANLLRELGGWLNPDRAIDGLTLGVDPEVYKPADDKDPYQLLWASDIGRGFNQMLPLFFKLHAMDKRFTLNVCYPDYCKGSDLSGYPGVVVHGNVPNGPDLFRLFNWCGVLPYPSTFPEPSSRAHRQAMAAGSLVLYPPAMGSPSELVEDGRTGYVRPIQEWPRLIYDAVKSGEWSEIGARAREYAVSESWDVQAGRFKKYFEEMIKK